MFAKLGWACGHRGSQWGDCHPAGTVSAPLPNTAFPGSPDPNCLVHTTGGKRRLGGRGTFKGQRKECLIARRACLKAVLMLGSGQGTPRGWCALPSTL